jgi:hypothetical protein
MATGFPLRGDFPMSVGLEPEAEVETVLRERISEGSEKRNEGTGSFLFSYFLPPSFFSLLSTSFSSLSHSSLFFLHGSEYSRGREKEERRNKTLYLLSSFSSRPTLY